VQHVPSTARMRGAQLFAQPISASISRLFLLLSFRQLLQPVLGPVLRVPGGLEVPVVGASWAPASFATSVRLLSVARRRALWSQHVLKWRRPRQSHMSIGNRLVSSGASLQHQV